MMKVLSVFTSILLICSAASPGGRNSPEDRYLNPNSEFKNQTREVVYLVVALNPGEAFQNNTASTFEIITPKDFERLSLRLQLDFKIEMHQERVSAKHEMLEELDSEIQSVSRMQVGNDQGP